ncbi:MAG: tyrosine-type recombinase/integrase [Solirubrobacteraceae bacterium]
MRHTAATWLRQATGDTRLVAEYLGHADLSTVSRYAHVAAREMHTTVQALARHCVYHRPRRRASRRRRGRDARLRCEPQPPRRVATRIAA